MQAVYEFYNGRDGVVFVPIRTGFYWHETVVALHCSGVQRSIRWQEEVAMAQMAQKFVSELSEKELMAVRETPKSKCIQGFLVDGTGGHEWGLADPLLHLFLPVYTCCLQRNGSGKVGAGKFASSAQVRGGSRVSVAVGGSRSHGVCVAPPNQITFSGDAEQFCDLDHLVGGGGGEPRVKTGGGYHHCPGLYTTLLSCCGWR